MSAKRNVGRRKSTYPRAIADLSKTETFDLITSMYFECFDDNMIAEAVCAQYEVNITANEVRAVRHDAAAEAETENDPALRRKWAFRYQNVTVNNLSKEFMFMNGSFSFLEAKIEFSDELFWLQEKYSDEELCTAVNHALGRTNIPYEAVEDFIDFRNKTVRVKELIKAAAKRTGQNATLLLLDVAAKVDKAYQSDCNRNKVLTMSYTAGLLGMDYDNLTPSDVDFFREINRSAIAPDRSGTDSRALLLGGSDSLQGRSIMDEAMYGDTTAFTSAEAQQLAQELTTNSLLKPKHLHRILGQVNKRLKKKRPGYKMFQELQKILKTHLLICDLGKLFSWKERLKLKLKSVDLTELQSMLTQLNELGSYDEVTSYLSIHLERHGQPGHVVLLGKKYCMKRFRKSFKPPKPNSGK